MTLRRDLARFHGGENGTAGLFQVRAVAKTALADVRPELPERILQIFARDRIDHVHFKGCEPRRIGDKCICPERIELHMARCVLAAAEPLADSSGRNAERCIERVEQTRLADAGVAREGAVLSAQRIAQLDDFLKNGIIDKAEYRTLREGYERGL